MTIIDRAKRLFENRYHDEPWLALFDSSQERFWIETDNFAEVCGDFVSEDDTRLAAAAPDLAQALAEEEWQYGVTYIGVKHGGHHIEWVESTGDAEFDKETLQLLVKRWKVGGQSPKVVRRRVSKPEPADWPSPYSQPHNTQRNIMQANLPTDYQHNRRQGDAGLDLRAAGEDWTPDTLYPLKENQ